MLNSDAARNGDGQSGALVIFARVEGLRRERTHDSSAEAGDRRRFVSRQGVPLVLVSAWEAAKIRQLQRDVGLSQPFICEDGAALHVPQRCPRKLSADRSRSDDETGWEVFRFNPSSLAATARSTGKATSMGKVRIVLADDHTIVRQGLRKVLEERSDWEVVAEAGDGREAVRLCEQHRPDIAILDVAMPLLNGIEATRQITKRAPNTRVLVLSMHADEAYVTQILRAGATGYLLKDSADVDLFKAVEEAAKGRSFFSPAIARLMLDDYRRQMTDKSVSDRYEMLSDREREILQLVAEAKANKEIAALLNVSTSTVETHRAHIMEKLDLHSAAEIVLYAVRRGVIR